MDANVLYFDFETTSMDPDTAMVVEFEAELVRYAESDWGSVKAEMSRGSLVDPRCSISPGASSVHGIMTPDVSGAGSLESHDGFRKMASVADFLCGHNAKAFDVPIARRLLGGSFEKPVIDTLVIARKMWPEVPSKTLPALSVMLWPEDFADMSPADRRSVFHEARFDVARTRKIAEHVGTERGLRVRGLYEWQETVEPAEIFSFGKRRGDRVVEVCEDDPDLARWYMKQGWFVEKYPAEHLAIREYMKRRGGL